MASFVAAAAADSDFSAIHVSIAVAMVVVQPYSMQHSLVAYCLYCIRVLLVMVAIALNFHLLIDSLSLPVANDYQPSFDCIVVAVWLDSECHYRYLNGHFVNLM